MRIALATPRVATSIEDGLDRIKHCLAEAAAQGAAVVCFPETVRWAAVRGARIVFHPHLTGYEIAGTPRTQWGAADGPYYEQAMLMRSRENTIYFASVNYALRFQESATSLIAPSGVCQAYLPYGQEGILVQAINVEEATGLLATRYAPERYQECS